MDNTKYKNYTMTNPLFYSMIEEDYLKGIRSDAAYDGMLCYYSPKTNNLYCGGDEEKISIYDVDKKPMTSFCGAHDDSIHPLKASFVSLLVK